MQDNGADIRIIKDDILDLFERAGFDIQKTETFEEINDTSAYVHPSLKMGSETLSDLIDHFQKLSGFVDGFQDETGISLTMDVVSHMPGNFMFEVSVE
jgi:hypothetical protein